MKCMLIMCVASVLLRKAFGYSREECVCVCVCVGGGGEGGMIKKDQ